MEIRKVSVLPKFTEAKTSKRGFLNKEDLHNLLKNALVFLTPTITLYTVQLVSALNDHTALRLSDLVPSLVVIGAFEGHVIATFIDYLKKLNDGGK